MRHSTKSKSPAGDLPSRVRRALDERRSQRALELAKTLFRQEPTPAHRELLRQAYLARGKELRERGYHRDSLIVLRAAAESKGDDPPWLAKLAEEYALSGGIAESFALLPRLNDPAVQERVLAHTVDAAVEQGSAGQAKLPEAYQADYERIHQAFRLSESGQHEAAREALAGVGLRSPFLDWKLLIRGLTAYYAGDDARARENWQRLNPERIPARLAAPMRQAIDSDYRDSQPAATQTALQQDFDRLHGSPLPAQLRKLRTLLADQGSLNAAFRQAEVLLPELGRIAPELVERLARVFYWTLLETGPDDIPRFQRIFAPPPLDPQFNRLQALAYEHHGLLAEAHKHWQNYEQEIAGDPVHWPEEQAARARALIWLEMGRNAAKDLGRGQGTRLPRRLRDSLGEQGALRPSAEQCFRRAVELAPDLLEAHTALFECYQRAKQVPKAKAAAQQLLKRFPDHVPTLRALGQLLAQDDEYAEALALYQRALGVSPLDPALRMRVVSSHLACARLHAVAKHFDLARKEIEAAARLEGETFPVVLLVRSAAVELKAGAEERAEEILAQALQKADSEVLVAFLMLVDATRLKLPKNAKARFDEWLAAGLRHAVPGATAAEVARTAVSLARAASYVGQKTHEKKALACVERAKKADFTESDLYDTCAALLHLDSVRLARHFIKRGQSKFRSNPYFPYLEAISYFEHEGPDEVPYWKARPLLEKAERLARALPPSERLRALLEDIGVRLKALAVMDPFSGLFGNLFGSPYDFEDEDED
jgi:tetratricopeptide (TPR) repeat protein